MKRKITESEEGKVVRSVLNRVFFEAEFCWAILPSLWTTNVEHRRR